jgi:nitroreductase
MILDLVKKNRSYRRFDQNAAIDVETLRGLVDCARFSPSGRNLQPYRYILSNEPEKNAAIFTCLAWAAYLADWPGPVEGERPAAYIIAVLDTSLALTPGFDLGLSLQSMLLAAVEGGLGGCIISSVKRDDLRKILNLAPRYEIQCVIALGKPVETVVVDPLSASGDIHYWRDEQGVHHVPKRSLDDLILRL